MSIIEDIRANRKSGAVLPADEFLRNFVHSHRSETETSQADFLALRNGWDSLANPSEENFCQLMLDSNCAKWLPFFASKFTTISPDNLVDRISLDYNSCKNILLAMKEGTLRLSAGKQAALLDEMLHIGSVPYLVSAMPEAFDKLDSSAIAKRMLAEYSLCEFLDLPQKLFSLSNQAEYALLLFEKGHGERFFKARSKFDELSDEEVVNIIVNANQGYSPISTLSVAPIAAVFQAGLSVIHGLTLDIAKMFDLSTESNSWRLLNNMESFRPEDRLSIFSLAVPYFTESAADILLSILNDSESISSDDFRVAIAKGYGKTIIPFAPKVIGAIDEASVLSLLIKQGRVDLLAENLEFFSSIDKQELLSALLYPPFSGFEDPPISVSVDHSAYLSAAINNREKFGTDPGILELLAQIDKRLRP